MDPAAFQPRKILSLQASITEARTLISGTKRVFFAYALTFLIPVTLVENTFFMASSAFALTFSQQLIVNVVTWLLQAFLALALATAGLARARGEPVRYDYLWKDYQHLPSLAIYLLVQLAVAQLANYSLVLGGLVTLLTWLYLMFTSLFIVDRGMNPLEAMWASARAFQANAKPLLLYVLLGVGLLIACFLTVGILTFWVLPFMAILLGVLFLEVAGPVTSTSAALPLEQGH